ncbi:hypothetical protein Tco_1329233 [Tanacetum coccineum]
MQERLINGLSYLASSLFHEGSSTFSLRTFDISVDALPDSYDGRVVPLHSKLAPFFCALHQSGLIIENNQDSVMSSEVDCLVEKHSSDDWAMSAICLDRFTLVVVKRLLDPTPIPGGLIVHNLEYQLNNQATIQDGRVVVQNVQGRQNHNQRRFAWGNGTAGNGGAHNRAGNANAGTCTQSKRPQNPDYFKDKTLLMQAQKNGAVLNEEELLFLASKQGNTFDADVDNQPVQDLALNEDNIFQADECDAFDSDVDDESTAQSIFMANLSLVGSANPQAGPSMRSILSGEWMINDRPKCQPALYDGRWNFLSLHQVPVIVPSSEEELELAEATRNKLHVKMNDSACVEKRVNITPPNYSKENFMATFTPQTQLTPEQVFWSLDLAKRKAEELKANATPLPVLPPATVYPPNTPAHLVPRNVPQYKSKHFEGIQKSLVTEVRAMKAVFENLEAEVDQNEIDLRSGEIEQKNLLITNENLVAECLSKMCFYTATDFVLNRRLDF